MGNQIRMTPENMRTRAQQYTQEANKLQEVISKMDSLLSTLQSEWEGEASKAYATRFGELRPGFVKAKDLIDEISSALTKTANIVEQTDSQIASQFRG